MAKHRKRKGTAQSKASSKITKAGRPREEGARFPSGKLRPRPRPNERVLAERRRLLGSDDLDVSLASNPLDLAHARNWLTQRQYKAARALGGVARRAGFAGLRMAAGGPEETPTSAVEYRGQIGEMTHAELAAAWDNVFNRTGLENPEQVAAEAMAKWREIHAVLTVLEAGEIDRICAQGVWPPWIEWKVEHPGEDLPEGLKRRKRVLEHALDKVAKVIWPPKITAPPPPAENGDKLAEYPSGPLREEVADYVDRDGNLLYQVVRKRRGAVS